MIDCSWAEHAHSEACPCTRQADEFSRCKLRCYSVTWTGTITVPTWICGDCLTISTPRAMPRGFFPSSPEIPTAWISTKLLHLYGELGPVAGLSVTGTRWVCFLVARTCELSSTWSVIACSVMHWTIDTNGCVILCTAFVKGINCMTGSSLDHRVFQSAYFAYARVVEGMKDLVMLGVTDIDEGPCSACPICADTPGV